MQQTSKKSPSHIYDYIIIGSGLSGLCVASALSKITDNILLVESSDSFGGHNRGIQTALGVQNNGLRFFPSGTLSHRAIAFLEALLLKQLEPRLIETPPVTYESGGLTPFVGFGDAPPDFYDDISYFAAPAHFEFSESTATWTQCLFDNYTGEFAPRSYVTRILMDENNERATGVIVNGQKTILGENIIYSGPLKQIRNLVGDQVIGAKAATKLGKSTFWTAVCLDILHSSLVTDNPAIHILNGTTQDDIGPCAGQFVSSPPEATNQYSQWITFVADEDAEDTEKVGAALKKIRRQIKRAYPEALDQVQHERILVVPSFSGSADLQLSANGRLAKTQNIWILSPSLHPEKNILGSLLQAELISSALGCHPLGVLDPQATTKTLDEAPL